MFNPEEKLFVVICLIFIAITGITVSGLYNRGVASSACEKKGGVYIETTRSYKCIQATIVKD
jgi:hypothetical protein